MKSIVSIKLFLSVIFLQFGCKSKPSDDSFIYSNSTPQAGARILRVTLHLPAFRTKRIVKKIEEVMNLCEELKTTRIDNQNYTNQICKLL